MPIKMDEFDISRITTLKSGRTNNRINISRVLRHSQTFQGCSHNDGHKYKNYPYMYPIMTDQNYAQYFNDKHTNEIITLLSGKYGYSEYEIATNINIVIGRCKITTDLDKILIKRILTAIKAQKVTIENKGTYYGL